MKQRTTIIAASIILLAGICTAAAQDVKGGKDHPILTRMPNFFISEYKETEFDSHRFIGDDKKPVVVEGRKYYIEYRLSKGVEEPGELKIRRNVQDALRKIGGAVRFDDNFNKASTIVVQRDGKETWIEVRSYNAMYRLTIVERAIMKQELVADAAAMGEGISMSGHVSVYGIHFDTGKSDILPESGTALAEIAKLLKDDPALKLYVVGHTDNVGALDFNMQLSKSRADAVSKTLVEKYGIDAGRLASWGVGSLSPVASNGTDDGRARNRRVELVKQ